MLSGDIAQYPVARFLTAREGPEWAGFTSIFGLRQPRFMKKRIAKITTITITTNSTTVVSVIEVIPR